MKKILLAISMMLTLMACVKEVITLPSETVDADGEILLSLSAVVPEAKIATKGTFTAPTITSLNVLMFDDKGFMVANAVALNEDGSEWTAKDVTDDIVKFKVTLPKTGNSCTLHFVANASVPSGTYGMETDVIASLTTEGTQDAYWQKVQLSRLIDVDDLTKNNCPVQLIRNHAKVTLVSSVKHFKPTGYALVNYPTKGTVAPYNTTYGTFQEYNTGNDGKDYEELVGAKYSAFMPPIDNTTFSGFPQKDGDVVFTSLKAKTSEGVEGFTVEGDPLYTYESVYGNTFLLVRGVYDENKDGVFDHAESYYKIDFYDPSLGNCDILRNINYQFSITNVVGAGYADVVSAADKKVPAGNNISNSLLTQSLVNISDGTQRLSVEYTSKYLISAAPFTLKYMFQPNISSAATDNRLAPAGPITITDEVTDKLGSKRVEFNVLDPGATNGYSTIQIIPQDFPAKDGDIYQKRITITSNYDGVTMSRIVDLYFMDAFQMNVACDPKIVAGSVGSGVTIKTTIPGNLPEVLFPLVFDIESDASSLYPDTAKELANKESEYTRSMPVVSGASTIEGVTKNTFHYQRTLTVDEYKALGGKPGESGIPDIIFNSYFKTNIAASASSVYVSNQYFTQDSDYFVNESTLFDGGFYGADNPVKVIVAATVAGTYRITSGDLQTKAVDNSVDLKAGELRELTLYTSDWSDPVSVNIAGPNNYSKSLTGAARNKLAMKAKSIKVNESDLTSYQEFGVYASEANAKNSIGLITKATSTGLRTESGSTITYDGLGDDTSLYFAYEDGDYVYVASATARSLHEGADLSFAGSIKPLNMNVEFGTGANRYGAGQAFTLTFTTNRTGKYKVTSANFNGVTVNDTFDAVAGTPITVECTHSSWNTQASITVSFTGDPAGAAATKTFTGPTRNILLLGKMTASSNPPSNDATEVEIRNASNTSTIDTVTWSQLKNGGVEVTIEGLAEKNSDAIVLRYSRYYSYYRKTSVLTATQAMTGQSLNFN